MQRPDSRRPRRDGGAARPSSSDFNRDRPAGPRTPGRPGAGGGGGFRPGAGNGRPDDRGFRPKREDFNDKPRRDFPPRDRDDRGGRDDRSGGGRDAGGRSERPNRDREFSSGRPSKPFRPHQGYGAARESTDGKVVPHGFKGERNRKFSSSAPSQPEGGPRTPGAGRPGGDFRPDFRREGPDRDRPGFDRPRPERPASDRPRFGGSDERRADRHTDRENGNRGFGRDRRDPRDRQQDRRARDDRREGGWVPEHKYRPDLNDDRRPGNRFEQDRPSSDRPGRPEGDRPRFDRDRPARPAGDRPRFDRDRPARPEGDRPRFDNDRPARPEGDRPRFDNDRPARPEGDRPRFDNDRPRFDNDRPRFDRDRPARPGSDRPRFGQDRDQQREAPNYNLKRYEKGASARGRKNAGRDADDEPKEGIRLNRYIANAGVCSRREADNLIAAGEIRVNGEVVKEMGYIVKPEDSVQYGKRSLKREKLVYVLLNKPKDYITTTEDPEERKTVMELVRNASKERVFPVGRLDRNTTGLLLFTNDGELAQKLTHPSHQMQKIYQVEIDKALKADDFKRIKEGLELEDGRVEVDDLAVVNGNERFVGIELHSGRNRIVRRIFEHLGYDVVSLDRVQYAGLTKKDLPRGNWRYLTEQEVVRLKYFL